MSGRVLLMLVAGIIFLSGSAFYQLYERGKDISANVDRAYLHESAQNIAESGVGIGMRKIADQPSWRTGIPSMDLLGGIASISAVDTTYLGKQAIMVTCTGILNQGSAAECRETSIAFVYGDTIPGIIQGTITTTHHVEQDTLFEVDGRDHEKDGVTCGRSGDGKKAVWTQNTCTSHDAAHLEGSDDHHIDSDGRNDTGIVAQNQNITFSFPQSPDSILSSSGVHFAEGTLKSAAQSGARGSQYATDPSTLTYPLAGLTYVELPAGGTWPAANVTGSGILVVHNASCNARLKNLNGGPFTGIVIADELDHVNCLIVGAVVTNGCQPDTIASGTGKICYSGKAVRESTGEVLRTVTTNGSRESAIAWKQ